MADKHTTPFNQLKNMLLVAVFGVVVMCALLIVLLADMTGLIDHSRPKQDTTAKKEPYKAKQELWEAFPMEAVFSAKDPELVKYGRDLIVHTSKYLGPKGSVAYSSNGMNCQNCHLEAGTKPWGNNYGAVAATYPKFRERSGTKESIIKRVNDCIERSLNGKTLDSASREMQAIVSYIKFIGQFVPKDTIPKGAGIWKLKFIDRPASPEKGKIAYEQKCVLCHQKDGQGLINTEGTGYTYPPLWGKNSYNNGAGLYRLSRFAGYIKANMPQGATWDKPQLNDEESWDIAAYVNSQPRPTKDLSKDWPKISGKPFDHPFGPFSDDFAEIQHKFGPFKPIDEYIKAQKKKKEQVPKLANTPKISKP
jgi:thiosulfate dehydrogenase